MEGQKKLIIIDSNSIIHRAFHALPPLTNKKGELVNVVYGFCLVFLKILKDLKPDFIAAAFDFPAPTLRHQEFKGYKAKRPKAPAELYEQIPKIKEVLETFKVKIFEKQGFEADDLIATIAKKAQNEQIYLPIEILIVTGDSDSFQLISKNIKVYILATGLKEKIIYDEEKIKEKFGLLPKQLIDFKALAGDQTDNIPGATGIGKKTAAELFKKFGDLENLYSKIKKKETENIKPRIIDILAKNEEQVFLSKNLVKLKDDVEIDFKLKNLEFTGLNLKEIKKMFENFGFHSLAKRVEEIKNYGDKC